MSPKQSNFNNDQLYLLDGLRVIAALCVVVFHYKNFFGSTFTSSLPENAYRNISVLLPFDVVLTHGAWAVMLFWSISGFVFAHVYYPRGERVMAKEFFVNRLSRLYPLHLVTLIYIAGLQFVARRVVGEDLIYGNNDLFHFALQLGFLSNWGFEQDLSFNGPIWSVSVEVAIYIAFFMALVTLGRSLWASLVMMCVFLVLGVIFDHNIPICGVYFYAGVLAHHAFERCCNLRRPMRLMTVLLALCVAALPIVAVTVLGIALPLTIQLASLFAVILFLLALHESSYPGRYRFLRPFGDLTYSSYLLHSPLQMTILLAGSFGFFPPGLLLQSGFVIIYLVALMALSRITFLYFERPSQKILRNFSQRRVLKAA